MTETLTRAGLTIPLLGLGTWDLDQKKCSRVVSEALDLGYRHIDAAAMYENESQVGAGIIDSKIDREELFLTTKINTTSWTPSGGSGPLLQNKNIIKSFEKSLLDLKTDYVDLLLIHWPRFETNLADMLEIMYEIKDSQKAKEIGVANFNSNLLKECVNFGFNDLFCNQIEYHPFLSQSKLFGTMKSLDIIPVAYCPICRGDVAKDDVIINLSDKYDKTPAQIALRWIIQQNAVAIPKTANSDRLKENIDIYDFHIDESDMGQIYNLSRNQRLVPNLESNALVYPWD
jgi:2,5-diketo-D-gluconate reductase B|tara:strand:- start:355 stop:1215 length:861 start_codon:yes stop_codon:yes gene_type:complete